MARIFHKYVHLNDEPEEPQDDVRGGSNKETVFNPVPKNGGSAVSFDGLIGQGEQKDSKMDIETVVPIYLLLHGIRNLIQSLKGMEV